MLLHACRIFGIIYCFDANRLLEQEPFTLAQALQHRSAQYALGFQLQRIFALGGSYGERQLAGQ